jgi:hypothetical protein
VTDEVDYFRMGDDTTKWKIAGRTTVGSCPEAADPCTNERRR